MFGILLTATGAGQDLFSEAWTEGNLYQISDIVSALGSFCCTIISIVGFGIVIFSILKNAMSGLYVVNPTFWDKVDDIKAQAVNGVSGTVNELVGKTNGNYAAQKVGGLFTFLLGLIPNIKALTDFDDGVPVDKKQYFMKSIPLLIAQIFIGMLIFFGYPAKIAEWIGNGATYAVSAIINNVDPVEVVANASEKFTVYNLATDGSQLPLEQVVNKMASEAVSVVKTRYSDIKKQPMQETAYDIENQLLSAFTEADSVVSMVLGASEGYNISVTSTAQSSVPTVSSAYRPTNPGSSVYYAQATNGTYSFKFWIQCQSLPTGVPDVASTDYLVWTVTATPTAVSNTSTANLIACAGIKAQATAATGASTASFTIQGVYFGKDNGCIQGTLGQNCTVEAIDSTGTVQSTWTAKIESATVSSSASTAVLTFAQSEKINVANALNAGQYLRVSLPGSWSYSVTNTSNNSTLTLRVSELRLVKDGTTLTGLLSTWTDIDASTSAGVTIDYSMTTRSTKN